MSVTDKIRDRLNATEETLYRVSKETGITWSTLKRFADGGKTTSDHVDKLAKHFGLTLCDEDGAE